MRILTSQSATFEQELDDLLAFETVNDPKLLATVDDIIAQVRQGGDDVVLKLTQQFDNHPGKTFDELIIAQDTLKHAFDDLSSEVKSALELSAKRIQTFHQKQVQHSWTYQDELGNTLGQQVTSLDKVGIYVPGGLASYPSSVLRNAIPAKVQGGGGIIRVGPPQMANLIRWCWQQPIWQGWIRYSPLGELKRWQHWRTVRTALPKWIKSQGLVINMLLLPNGRYLGKWVLT